MRQKRRTTHVDVRLPGHISRGFVSSLKALLEELKDYDTKGEYLFEQCFSKYCETDSSSAEVRRLAAIHKWMDAEARNEKTNSRLFYFRAIEKDLGWIEYEVLLRKIRRLIRQVLGPLRYSVLETGAHTNGASTRIKRSPKAAIEKVTGSAHGSRRAKQHWDIVNKFTILEAQNVTYAENSEMFTVPKSSDIDRVACKEPEVNMFLQRSVGNYIRARLKRCARIDLNDQTRNQQLAASAVKLGLATIDLSSASDSICRELVRELLPDEWFELLDDLRSASVLIKDYPEKGVDRLHTLQMMSSMGNGYTFELESLIFYAITRAVCWLSGKKGTISVYGDDIIAPASVVPRLKRVFDIFGFRLNMKKTFARGPFRESCGKHYYNGLDISPFYVRGPVSTIIDVIHILNRLLEWDGRGWGFISNPSVLTFHRKWSGIVPEVLWGGIDVESTAALVTGHRPRLCIQPIRKTVRYDGESGLTAWLVGRRLMGEIPLVIDPVNEVGYRYRPLRSLEEQTSWSPWLLTQLE